MYVYGDHADTNFETIEIIRGEFSSINKLVMSLLPADAEVSDVRPFQLLRDWRASYKDNVAVRYANLAQVMLAINVLGITDYAFLGIVELPACLESRGCDLCKLINNSQDQNSHSLRDFLKTLDRYNAVGTFPSMGRGSVSGDPDWCQETG